MHKALLTVCLNKVHGGSFLRGEEKRWRGEVTGSLECITNTLIKACHSANTGGGLFLTVPFSIIGVRRFDLIRRFPSIKVVHELKLLLEIYFAFQS